MTSLVTTAALYAGLTAFGMSALSFAVMLVSGARRKLDVAGSAGHAAISWGACAALFLLVAK